ncbi:MAG: hypothetical protein ABEI57_04175 [Halapricum sp.]
MDDDSDRPRGILSPADRAFLLGETEMTHEQSRRNAAARIRKRIHNAILDFTLLVHTLPAKDRHGVFESVGDRAFLDGLTAMHSLAYLGLKEQGIDYEQILDPAIRNAEEVYAAETLDSAVDVGVDLSVRAEYSTAVEDAAETIRDGLAVTPAELLSVVMADDPVIEDVSEIVVQLPHDTDPDDGVVQRLARYLDADVVHRSNNRVELDLV